MFNFDNSNGSITLITGPMWSGKTSELYKMLNMYQGVFQEGEIILIRFKSADNRDESERVLPGLDKRIKIISTSELNIQLFSNIMDKIKVVGIDEGQFFNDLRGMCLSLSDTYMKNVIVSGLNGDFKRNEFSEISSLIPVVDNIILKHSLCCECKDGTKGIFSIKTTNKGDDQIEIGGGDLYKTMCRKHYNYFKTTI
tara:strand:+ start:103 stop:693 length:591 start_codon:yes stop_codon:yes gene_type:complete